MTTAQLPESLLVEVAEHPERFRPNVSVGQEVLVLGRSSPTLTVGFLARVLEPEDDESIWAARVDDPQMHVRVEAWALVVDAEQAALMPQSRIIMVIGGAFYHRGRASEEIGSLPAYMVAVLPAAPEPAGLQALQRSLKPQVPDHLAGVTSWFAGQAAAGRAAGAAPGSRLPALLEAHERPAASHTALDQVVQHVAKVTAFRDPDVTFELADPGNDVPGQDEAGWDLDWDARLVFGDDAADPDGLGRGLHLTLSVSGSVQNRGGVTKSVTPKQLRAHARHLVALADRAEARQVEGRKN